LRQSGKEEDLRYGDYDDVDSLKYEDIVNAESYDDVVRDDDDDEDVDNDGDNDDDDEEEHHNDIDHDNEN
jgi:hypothetical protein